VKSTIISTVRRAGVLVDRFVRQFGLEVCWLGMVAMILLANTKAAGVTTLIGCSFAWGLGFMTACICKPNTSVSYDRPQGGN
jgi:energy-converting hydrogenase Eha subunit H